ncbi:MAG: hypothetical protein EBV30_11155, partial [Actinobacteria bacterium]|nr:hypothetical protein [Actinomycetota bacterium]
ILSHYDDTLGDFAHTGLRCAGRNPIARGQLRSAGFEVEVTGRQHDSLRRAVVRKDGQPTRIEWAQDSAFWPRAFLFLGISQRILGLPA